MTLFSQNQKNCRPFLGLIIAASILISACSSLPPAPPADDSEASTSEDHWRARGRFSYRSDEQSQSGNFDWRQQGDDYQLRLYGPLGAGTVRISGNDYFVRIQTSDQDISSDQPLSLLYRMTGLQIPLNSVKHWLVGETSSLNPSLVEMDSENRLTSFSEKNWALTYIDYEPFADREIPTEIQAQRSGIELRLLVSSWEPQ